jgi:hypothetical protein
MKRSERDENGVIVLSPYGFAIKEIGGKKYLVALTKEERSSLVPNNPLAEGLGECMTASNGNCIQNTCRYKCVKILEPHGYVCHCGF